MDDVLRVYQSRCADGVFVALPFGIRGPSTTLTARVGLEVNGRTLAPGDTLRVPGPAAILTGRMTR